MIPYLIVGAISAIVAFAATPVARRVALKIDAIDHPSDRKVHPNPTPLLGGGAIVLGVVVALMVAFFMPQFREVFRVSSEPLAALVGSVAIFLVGAYDDLRVSSVLGKLTWQLLVSVSLVLMGVQLLYFWFPTQGIITLSPDLAFLISVLWMVAMMNAVNFIDGLDGLAAGMTAIAAIAFFLYVYQGEGLYEGASPAALICAVTAGACLGFLPWNFNPAKIFMGDSGAMPLGLLLAVATIAGVGRNPYPPTGGDVAAFSIPILIPLLVLAIPFLDVSLAIIRRVRKGHSLGHADKEHIHHRLLDIGHTQREAVLLMYLWSGLISLCALAIAFIDGRGLVLVIVGVSLAIFLGTFVPRVFAPWRRKSNGDGSEDPDASDDEAPDGEELAADGSQSTV